MVKVHPLNCLAGKRHLVNFPGLVDVVQKLPGNSARWHIPAKHQRVDLGRVCKKSTCSLQQQQQENGGFHIFWSSAGLRIFPRC